MRSVSGRYTTPIARSSRRPCSSRASSAKRGGPCSWNSSSQLPGRPRRTCLRSAGPPQSEAVVTVPVRGALRQALREGSAERLPNGSYSSPGALAAEHAHRRS
jgi:hypothetical protein